MESNIILFFQRVDVNHLTIWFLVSLRQPLNVESHNRLGKYDQVHPDLSQGLLAASRGCVSFFFNSKVLWLGFKYSSLIECQVVYLYESSHKIITTKKTPRCSFFREKNTSQELLYSKLWKLVLWHHSELIIFGMWNFGLTNIYLYTKFLFTEYRYLFIYSINSMAYV